jgi:hypothetical protein
MSLKMLLGVLRAPHSVNDPLAMVQLISHARHAADKLEAMAAALSEANDCDIDTERSTDDLLDEWRQRHSAIISYVSDTA